MCICSYSGNSLSCFSLISFCLIWLLGWCPSCRGSCQCCFLCDVYSLRFPSLSVFVSNSCLIFFVFFVSFKFMCGNLWLFPQFGDPSRDFSSSELGKTGGTEFIHGSLLSGQSKSTWAGCGQSQYSKPYVLFSATDAASAAIDFSKSNVDDGVVDSPPNRGLRRSPIVLPSPLQGSLCRPRSDRSSSPTPRSSNTPHRQFYK